MSDVNSYISHQERDSLQSADHAADQDKKPKRIAIFTVHGMGQQIPFSTMDKVASGLLKRNQPGSSEPVGVRSVKMGDEIVERVEIALTKKSGAVPGPDEDLEAHIYEAYWAPITQGAIGLMETLYFLFSGAFNGSIRNRRGFWRYIFGGKLTFDNVGSERVNKSFFTETPKWYLFITANAVAAGVITFFIATVIFCAERIKALFGMDLMIGWPAADLRLFLYSSSLTYVLMTLFFGTMIGGAILFQKKDVKIDKDRWALIQEMINGIFYAWISVSILVAISNIVAFFKFTWFPTNLASYPIIPLRDSTLWVVLFVISVLLRKIIIQTLGDVAIYIASHKLDRFSQIRFRIKAKSSGLLAELYVAKDEEGEPYYDGVAIFSHSLGTVIAYDALNKVISDDCLRSEGDKINPQDRTPVFLTFGSPLDKTAYIFRQQDNQTSLTREALAALKQPLIQDYEKFRKNIQWVNVYSKRDPISGALDFYDDGNEKYKSHHIQNIEDPEALIPLIAHNEYWKNDCIWTEFLNRL